MTFFIDLHVLQTLPPANLNRDESGRPKSAVYGGVPRARVSSQAWKHAARAHFANVLSERQRGVRTLRATDLLADRIQALDPGIEREKAMSSAKNALAKLKITVETKRARKDAAEDDDPGVKTEYLVFFSNTQLDGLAELAVQGEESAKAYKGVMKSGNGIDLALFGRMVANDADLNVDASVQVAHALSTHAVETEFDFYTAVDDKSPKDETGAGMMGTIEFNSSVLYRYATVNVDLLRDQLAEPNDAVTATREFVRSFVESMPTGKQNTFANQTLPDAVVVSLREDRPISYVSAFEEPVRQGAEGGYLRASCEAMASYATDVVTQYSAADEQTWLVRVGERTDPLDRLGTRVTMPELLSGLDDAVTAYLRLA